MTAEDVERAEVSISKRKYVVYTYREQLRYENHNAAARST